MRLAHRTATAEPESAGGVSKARFLLGKLRAEGGCGQLEDGIAHLSAAVVSARHLPAGLRSAGPGEAKATVVSPMEVTGWAFHLARALYAACHYEACLWLLRCFTEDLVPDAWDTTVAGRVPELDGLQWQPVELEAVARLRPLCASGLHKYHHGMLLLALIVSAVHWPSGAARLHAAIAAWPPQLRLQLARQYNAEVRFVNVIERLLPLEPTAPFGSTSEPTGADVDRRMALYLLGESHILPLAWQRLSLAQGVQLEAVPRLVIGLKAWHTRPAPDPARRSRAHELFLRHAATIPAQALVLVCAGEIDLRPEGTIAGLPKGAGARPPKYASVDEAIAATVDAYAAGLAALVHARGVFVLVHPVRPVPPSGSPEDAALLQRLTAAWNRALQHALSAMNRVVFLDALLPALSDPHTGLLRCVRVSVCVCVCACACVCACVSRRCLRGWCRRPEYDIGDGIHHNRAYLPCAARAIDAAVASAGGWDTIMASPAASA
jgi:hypothetical protein